MKKKAAIWLFCLIQVVTLCIAPVIGADAAQIKAAKKIISVVYDDSGSMNDDHDSWAVANYAMQAFCGMKMKCTSPTCPMWVLLRKEQKQ